MEFHTGIPWVQFFHIILAPAETIPVVQVQNSQFLQYITEPMIYLLPAVFFIQNM